MKNSLLFYILIINFTLSFNFASSKTKMVKIPVKVLIKRLAKGIIYDGEYSHAPKILKLLNSGYRLKTMGFEVVEKNENWIIDKGYNKDDILPIDDRAKIKETLTNSKNKLIQTLMDYDDEVNKVLKKHKRVLTNNVKGTLVAHGYLIVTFRAYVEENESPYNMYLDIHYLQGRRGTFGEPMLKEFPEKKSDQKAIFDSLHN
jgi:hypothetical protein